MHSIKYRGLTKEGKWVYGWYCEVLGYHYIIPNDADIVGVKPPNTYGLIGFIEVIGKSVGQSTDRFDKNGKEIYEGDRAENTLGRLGTIVFSHIGNDSGWTGFWINYDGTKSHWPFKSNNIEIIGNIHENPELIGESK